jgi:hypothetical protein
VGQNSAYTSSAIAMPSPTPRTDSVRITAIASKVSNVASVERMWTRQVASSLTAD